MLEGTYYPYRISLAQAWQLQYRVRVAVLVFRSMDRWCRFAEDIELFEGDEAIVYVVSPSCNA